MPPRASSYDPYLSRSTPPPPAPQCQTPIAMSQSVFASHRTFQPTNMGYPPLSTDFDTTYFSKGATPEAALNSGLWDDTLKIEDPTGKTSDFDNFGLGLGTFDSDLSSETIKGADSELFNFPELNTEADPLNLGGSSPDGHSWSTLSESSGGVISDFSDIAAETDLGTFNPDFSIGFESVLPSIEDSTPTLAQPSLQKPHGNGVARSSPSHQYRTSPYPTTNASNPPRARSFTTGSMAMAHQRSSSFAYGAYPPPNLASQQASPLSCASHNISTLRDAEMGMFCKPDTTIFDNFGFNSQTTLSPLLYQEPKKEVSNSSLSITTEIEGNLPSSVAPKSQCEHQFAGSSEPPNLFGPLSERPTSPPPEDFQCENEDDVPRVQDLRFEGDLYTPKYVRGHGNKREGWCGICKTGRWLVLKNSAFWYDKSFTHGISAATGAAFESPKETRRMKSNPDVWEGLCHSCGEWIALISSKKKGTTWFRHAYKCHTHQKVKDTPKRRREQSQAKAAKAAKNEQLKNESREDSPFSLDMELSSLEENIDQQHHGSIGLGSHASAA
ncbi:MAG: hypothetical protein Q9191_002202 [Dirinaria sp. TL-2023a]